ncbi:MAG: 16S rRNA (guanine(527)-N(7))-methyltransferase RsmG [Elusimicrobia bacterium]|nr:16S rRNA (guanine(527)-N(7))-methyltransferase RsmG [Elusimicrobiota bacterium]
MTPEILDIFSKGLKLLNLELNPQQIKQFSLYFDELENWNSRFNLISRNADDKIIINHFLDSLSIIPAFSDTVEKDIAVLDVGSGAGFPGIPLKIAKPEIVLTLLDSSRKKTEFLRHLCKKIGITADVICDRAENAAKISAYAEKYDIVVARAVAKMATTKELCFPFLNKNGALVLQLGRGVNINMENGEVMLEFNPPSEILPGKSVLKVKRKPAGFTLIELMIVVAIIGILAAIAIPKFADVLRRTKQGRTKGELGTLRSALTLYYGGMEGVMYPQDAAAIENSEGPVQTKYLDRLSEVQLGPSLHKDSGEITDFNVDDPLTDSGSWGYISARGSIFVDCTHFDTKGEYISSW